MTEENKQVLLTPKFLPVKAVKKLVPKIVTFVLENFPVKRQACHVVILVPSMIDGRVDNYAEWPNYVITPYVLYQESFGNENDWPYRFDEISQCRVLQLWQDRNDGGSGVIPHLLFPGDTPRWGGVKREGIAVACAGIEPAFCRMTSGMIADALIACAHENMAKSEDISFGAHFLS